MAYVKDIGSCDPSSWVLDVDSYSVDPYGLFHQGVIRAQMSVMGHCLHGSHEFQDELVEDSVIASWHCDRVRQSYLPVIQSRSINTDLVLLDVHR